MEAIKPKKLTCSQLNGFIALLVNAEILGSNPFEVSNSLFHGWFFSFAFQCNLTWMRGNFGLKLQNSPKLPRLHVKLHCNSNEKN